MAIKTQGRAQVFFIILFLVLTSRIENVKSVMQIDYGRIGREASEKSGKILNEPKTKERTANSLKKAASKPGVQSVLNFFKPVPKKV